ncbi:hypothetical protein NG42_05575 [Winslowiella iniecta]|uniref:Enterochelin esterase N-terminal domain-containing protein n=1 Tax=Winslowiella iniecta TaxID=1560201 RepID=A0A0L7T7H6_9GAMM|nr:hypothetical protein NG42_05575 [Winslowiella iniecta]KOC94624.1 hypothetical protein NG43_03960 [Winslowiella iniecta]
MMLLRNDIGSETWWQEVVQLGTPIIEPAVNKRHTVTFLWRDPQGDESRSATRRVWINITGISDHHQQGLPQSLQRIAGTDVWQWQTQLDASWRGSYSLIPHSAEDPFLQAQTSDVTMQRNSWRSLFADAIGDPLNHHGSWKSGRGHPTSPLHMPLAPPQTYWQAAAQQPPHQCQRYQWSSSRLGNSRSVWLITTGSRAPASRPLAILLDGQFWAQTMPVGGPLQAMTDAGELPEAVYLLIDSINPQQRSVELPCHADFWLAVQEELLPQLAGWAAHDSDPTRTVVAGQSFGGLSAVYAVLNWPRRFGCALSLSGSFWWPQRDLAEKSGWLSEQIAQASGSGSSMRFLLEAGKREPLIITVNDRLSQQLDAAGHDVEYHQIDGGHDALWWRSGLTDGLQQLWSAPQFLR